LHYTTQLIRIRKQQTRVTNKVIVDSQSVKCTKSCGIRGIDGNKKVKGIKRHRITDMEGLPIVTTITKASSGDRLGAKEMISRYKGKLEQLEVKEFFCDQGYSGKLFRNTIAKLTGAVVTVVPRESKELGFVPLPNRWVIERTNAWCDDYRRLWKACEGLVEVNEAVVTITDTFRAVRRLTNGKSKRWISRGRKLV
jgi:transposase